jgi:hypothetical protein
LGLLVIQRISLSKEGQTKIFQILDKTIIIKSIGRWTLKRSPNKQSFVEKERKDRKLPLSCIKLKTKSNITIKIAKRDADYDVY